MFLMKDGVDLDAVVEDKPVVNSRPASRNSVQQTKKEDHRPAPLLPEIGKLGSGNTTGGDLGWDEAMFKR